MIMQPQMEAGVRLLDIQVRNDSLDAGVVPTVFLYESKASCSLTLPLTLVPSPYLRMTGVDAAGAGVAAFFVV